MNKHTSTCNENALSHIPHVVCSLALLTIFKPYSRRVKILIETRCAVSLIETRCAVSLFHYNVHEEGGGGGGVIR